MKMHPLASSSVGVVLLAVWMSLALGQSPGPWDRWFERLYYDLKGSQLSPATDLIETIAPAELVVRGTHADEVTCSAVVGAFMATFQLRKKRGDPTIADITFDGQTGQVITIFGPRTPAYDALVKVVRMTCVARHPSQQ